MAASRSAISAASSFLLMMPATACCLASFSFSSLKDGCSSTSTAMPKTWSSSFVRHDQETDVESTSPPVSTFAALA
jgi:hypothetical protein